MKTTMKRLISTVLAMVMLISLFTISAVADDGISIITNPQDTTAESGEAATLSVEAQGENLTYRWYAWLSYGAFPLDDDAHGVEGADTPTLKILSSDCRMNAISFYCKISSVDGIKDSEEAIVTVPHVDDVEYVYSETLHLERCSFCKMQFSYGEHAETDCVCGYVAGDSSEQEALVVDGADEVEIDATNGEAVQLHVTAVGLNNTYQWEIYDRDIGNYFPLANGQEYDGVTTDTLTIYSPNCRDGQVTYLCTVSNNYANDTVNYHVEAPHVYDEVKKTPHSHVEVCVCGDEGMSDYHYDSDCDGICDDCEYVFTESAPKITAQPESIYPQNGHEPVTMTVTASGEGLTYQWHSYGGILIDDEQHSGVNTATLTITSQYDEDEGIYDCNAWSGYYCVVSNSDGTVCSDTAFYEPEHANCEYAEPSDGFYHYVYCVCGEQYKMDQHIDADYDMVCDLCEGEMEDPFKDVSDTAAWYYEAAVYAKIFGIFKGEYGNLLPDNYITRGEVATVIARLAIPQEGIDEMSDLEFEELIEDISEYLDTTSVQFTDIEGKYYERHVRIAAAIGLINGYEGGEFRGEEKITREELATVLMRVVYLIIDEDDLEDYAIGTPVAAFGDADEISDWAKDYVEDARILGLFCGDQYGNFNADDYATRAETAQTMMRLDLPSGVLLYFIL